MNFKPYIAPHVFTYHKDTGELTYDSVMMYNRSVLFDENGKLTDNQAVRYDLSENERVLALVKKLALNALEIEKEFGAPQDIEGGIKGNDIYLWQTRNIVFN